MRPLEGGRFCGKVRYRARSVFDAGYCHCTEAWDELPHVDDGTLPHPAARG